MALRKVVVTGGNSGIGFALCKQLAVEDGCHVYLGSRSEERGQSAVDSILADNKDASIELLVIDVSSDESVAAAAAKLAGVTLYGLCNNAGAGLAHGLTAPEILEVNLEGPRRVCEAFIPLLDKEVGRIVNTGSGLGPMYVKGQAMGKPLGNATAEQKACLMSFDVTWEQVQGVVAIEDNFQEGDMDHFCAYGLSKAGLTAYTMMLAKAFPNIISSCISPGFIDTALTQGFGAKLSPEQGTVSGRHCLLAELKGNGWYYGSDAVRSPLDVGREPGEPEYVPE
jgi:NAD(P)-dependent dehydrogenase (short-subunit alcohol dehydrogenase family)